MSSAKCLHCQSIPEAHSWSARVCQVLSTLLECLACAPLWTCVHAALQFHTHWWHSLGLYMVSVPINHGLFSQPCHVPRGFLVQATFLREVLSNKIWHLALKQQPNKRWQGQSVSGFPKAQPSCRLSLNSSAKRMTRASLLQPFE